MTKTMIMRSDLYHLITIKWCDGVCEIVGGVDGIIKDMQKHIDHGLCEWMGEGIDATPRETLSSDPQFLPRLADYFKRQFDFDIKITDG